MDWKEEVQVRFKRGNQVLFSKTSEYLQDLTLLFQGQDHRVMVLWALSLAEETVEKLERKYPDEKRPREALEAAQAWAAGEIKMRPAQRKILDCHAAAKSISSREDMALFHAVGQACAVVHTAGHAIGFPIYELSAIIYREGLENCAPAVERRKREYIGRLFYWSTHWTEHEWKWAAFLLP